MKVLELGCGKNKTKGAIGLDKYKLDGVDVVHDLERPLPFFKNNTFDVVIANHVLEHINNFFGLMEEIHRILKPNGIVKIRVPYYRSVSAFGNPTHVRFFTSGTFNYFGKFNEDYYTKSRFEVKKIKLGFVPVYFLGIWERYFSHLIPFREIYFELEKVKMNDNQG